MVLDGSEYLPLTSPRPWGPEENWELPGTHPGTRERDQPAGASMGVGDTCLAAVPACPPPGGAIEVL